MITTKKVQSTNTYFLDGTKICLKFNSKSSTCCKLGIFCRFGRQHDNLPVRAAVWFQWAWIVKITSAFWLSLPFSKNNFLCDFLDDLSPEGFTKYGSNPSKYVLVTFASDRWAKIRPITGCRDCICNNVSSEVLKCFFSLPFAVVLLLLLLEIGGGNFKMPYITFATYSSYILFQWDHIRLTTSKVVQDF